MASRLSIPVRNARVDAVKTALDGGPAAGYVEIRTGTQPATPGTAATGTLLATCTLSDPSFPAASAGSATASAITQDSSADATGTAGWFRGYDSTGVAVIDGAVGAEMTLNNTSIVAGGTVSITSWVLTEPVG